MSVCCVCVRLHSSAQRGQKRASDPLELELEVIMNFSTWVLGIKLRSTWRTAGPLNHYVISLVPHLSFIYLSVCVHKVSKQFSGLISLWVLGFELRAPGLYFYLLRHLVSPILFLLAMLPLEPLCMVNFYYSFPPYTCAAMCAWTHFSYVLTWAFYRKPLFWKQTVLEGSCR